ncbi:hypothetical protein BN982_03591 [Halobacillus karajensis]|uniref:Uncharacterized protein n=1 Tax=Halobacillus karajensis TaxID=195088 RepID=A0A024P6R2_9BACI|nr:hypothetical protein BN982_03591 [Halobacillus karajensis]CDQ24714.1 hypothetical protein BN983_03010 [Halobacillus karajensis]CDQ28926.1 hypothetical protein BN981_03244 [Halobacillus karajensis]
MLIRNLYKVPPPSLEKNTHYNVITWGGVVAFTVPKLLFWFDSLHI